MTTTEFDFDTIRRRTQDRFEPLLKTLEESQVLEAVTCSRKNTFMQAASKFFCVLKSNLKLRAIFDSRMAGMLGLRPPPVNLPTMQHIIGTGARAKYFWTADFKHWCYQIPIHENLRELFVTKCTHEGQTRYRRMKVLPQGWSWSPYIAQSMGWAIIAYREDQDSQIFDEAKLKQVELPTCLERRDAEGNLLCTVFLWYDNIMVCGDSSNAVEKTAKRISLNAKRLEGNSPKQTPTFKLKPHMWASTSNPQSSPSRSSSTQLHGVTQTRTKRRPRR